MTAFKLAEGCVPHLPVRQRGEYGTWCLAALEREEALIRQFIEYWEGRNPRLVVRADAQLGWIWEQKRYAV